MTDEQSEMGEGASTAEEVSIASKVPANQKTEIRMLASVNDTTMSRWVADAIAEKLSRTPDRTRALARELAKETGHDLGDEGNKRRHLVSAD